MPEIEGLSFPEYVFQEWPKHVTNSNGQVSLCQHQGDVDEFLKGDPAALKRYHEQRDAQMKQLAWEDSKAARIRQIEMEEPPKAAAAPAPAPAPAPAASATSPKSTPQREMPPASMRPREGSKAE